MFNQIVCSCYGMSYDARVLNCLYDEKNKVKPTLSYVICGYKNSFLLVKKKKKRFST